MESDAKKLQEIEKREKAYLSRMKKHVPNPNVAEFEFHGFNRDELHFLSPFSPHAFVIDDSKWPTVNHYLQALRFDFFSLSVVVQFLASCMIFLHRFDDPGYQERIRSQPNPFEATWLGRNKSVGVRPNWDGLKEDVMITALEQKFRQNDDIRKALLATSPRHIVCHCPDDPFWGDGANGSGRNRLGEMLEVR